MAQRQLSVGCRPLDASSHLQLGLGSGRPLCCATRLCCGQACAAAFLVDSVLMIGVVVMMRYNMQLAWLLLALFGVLCPVMAMRPLVNEFAVLLYEFSDGTRDLAPAWYVLSDGQGSRGSKKARVHLEDRGQKRLCFRVYLRKAEPLYRRMWRQILANISYVIPCCPRQTQLPREDFDFADWHGPVAFAEIMCEDLVERQESEWSLLLQHFGTHEAVYSSPEGAQETAPAFLTVTISQSTGALLDGPPAPGVGQATSERTQAAPDGPPVRGAGQAAAGRTQVMMFTRGTRGDVQPFLALAVGLIEHQECEVTIVTEICQRGLVRQVMGRLASSGRHLHFRPSGGNTARKLGTVYAKAAVNLGMYASTMQALFLSRSEVEFFQSEGCFYYWAARQRPHLIVFGFTVTHAAMIVSEALQIPIVGFNLQPFGSIQPMSSRTYADQVLRIARAYIRWPGCQQRLKHTMETWSLNRLRRARNLNMCPRASLQGKELCKQEIRIISPIHRYVLDSDEIATMPDGQNYEFTNFIFLPKEGAVMPDGLDEFIQHHRSRQMKIVMMAFSSMPVEKTDMAEIAWEVIDNFDNIAIVVIAGAGDLSDFRECHRLWVGEKAPFEALIPEIDVAILQGGLGVVSEAFRAGKPVITSGVLLLDQLFWGRTIAKLGTGTKPMPIYALRRNIRDLLAQAVARDVQHRSQVLQEGLCDEADRDGVILNARAVAGALEWYRANGTGVVRGAYGRFRCNHMRLCCWFLPIIPCFIICVLHCLLNMVQVTVCRLGSTACRCCRRCCCCCCGAGPAEEGSLPSRHLISFVEGSESLSM